VNNRSDLWVLSKGPRSCCHNRPPASPEKTPKTALEIFKDRSPRAAPPPGEGDLRSRRRRGRETRAELELGNWDNKTRRNGFCRRDQLFTTPVPPSQKT
jgi:hypothetical protein